MKMMRKSWLYYIGLVWVFLGCSHDPGTSVENGEAANVCLSLRPEIVMENMDEGVTARSSKFDLYDFRYTLEVWDGESGERVHREVMKGDLAAGTDVSFDLPQGTYNILVWGDLVDRGTLMDKYYVTDTLTRVQLIGEPIGMYNENSDGRDAFAAKCSIKLGGGEDYSGQLLLERVVAQVVVKATDVAACLHENFGAGSHYYLNDVCTEYNVKTGEAALSQVTLKNPGDATEVYDAEGNMVLFSDYFFVGTVDRVSVGFNLYFSSETETRGVVVRNIPLKANCLTEVKGCFLTDEGMTDIDLSEVK